MEQLTTLLPQQLHPFPGNPFGLHSGEELNALVASVSEFGVIAPLLVRPICDGEYEIISGHRRWEACMKSGINHIPAVVRDMDDDMAVIALVDGNLHRENLLPSEKARAYQMKMDALARMRKRTKENIGAHREPRKRMSQILSEEVGESPAQIKRYIRLNSLEAPLLDLVDAGRVALTPAVQLSYLNADRQLEIAQAIEAMDSSPSLSQAMRLRELGEKGTLNSQVIESVISEEKANQREMLRLPREAIAQYLPRNLTDKQMTEMIVRIISDWHLLKQKKRTPPVR